jgi:folate-binding protein YgfZ
MDEVDDPRAMFDDVAVVDVGGREVIRATGADRVAFLHRLLTGNVVGTPVGGGSHSLLLNLKGHVVSDLRVFVLADEIRLVVAAGQGTPTALALARYAIMDDFTATPDPTLRLLAVHGPRAAERLVAAGAALSADFGQGPLWSHEEIAWSGNGTIWAVRARAFGAEGIWVFAPDTVRASLAARLSAAGGRRLAPSIAEALRIENGEPLWGVEITDDYFPMEIGLDPAIDYSKGCYLGQEPIVRIRDRGHINWRLVRLRVREDVVPTKGDTLESEVKPRAGRVTSAARLPGEPPTALALLHVSVPTGSEVRIKHGEALLSAEVQTLPPAV